MRERRASLSWITLVILLLACITVQGVSIVEASPGPKVNVDPPINTAAPDEAFNVSITVTGITVGESLYGWEFTLSFDPSVLEVASHIEQVPIPVPPFYENVTVYHIYEGPFLKDSEDTLFIPYPNNTRGTVKVLCTFNLPYPPQGAVGNGVLATIEFRVKAEGATLLHFDYTELYTVKSGKTDLIAHEAFDGVFEYPLGVHDIAVTNVTPSPTSVPLGENVTINVTVENQGNVPEAFNVTAYYDNTEIGTQTFINLASLTQTTLTFTWDTTGVAADTYTIKAKAYLVNRDHPETSLAFLETDKADNTLIDGEVTILSPPTSSFNYSPSEPIASKTATFNSTSSDPDGWIVSWTWDLNGDGVIDATTENTTYTYTEPGTYTVNLTVTDNDGLTDTATDDITVLAHDISVTKVTASHIAVMPGVQVTINVTVVNEGDFPETFNVTAYYDNTIIGTKSVTNLASGASETLTINWETTGVDLGPYTIKAVADTVTDEIDTTNNERIYGNVTVAPFNKVDYPVEVEGVTFHVIIESNSTVSNFQLIQENKEINFNVTGPLDTVGYCNITISKKLLSVNSTHPWLVLLDGMNITDTTSIDENATHTFIYFTYTLSTRNVKIIGAILATPTPPVAIFTPSTTSAYVGDLITFNATASKDPDGEIASYQWNFGDGTTEIYMKNVNLTSIATHDYTAAGNYTVTLIVTDDDGLTDTNTINITILWVRDVAITNLTVFPNTVKIGEPVYISVTVANEGNYPHPESLTVRVYYDNSVVKFFYNVKLAPLTETTLNYTWNTKGVAAGEYTIKANTTLHGDANPDNNELVYDTVTIEKLSSTISISASPTTMTLGESTTISGSITPMRAEVTVTIQYRPAGENWIPLTTLTTDADGHYSYDWTPTTAGTYELKASWPGDANTESTESGVITIEAVEIHDIALEVGGVTFHVIIESNSTVSNFQLISEIKEIRFDVTGLSNTVGFCNVTIPLDLLGGPHTVQVDDLLIISEETTNGTHTFLYFTYNHSTQTIKIKGVTVATPPTAFFTPSTTSAYVGDLITFNATASKDPDGEIASYQWNFGDGTPIVTETDPIATHKYTLAGTYPVTLTVTDNQGLTDTATGTATISAKHDVAVVEVTPFPSEVTVGKLVSINVTVVNEGTETETFNITVYYDNTIIGTKSVTNLASGASQTLTINWETTGVDPGTYTIKAVASTITGEIDITNNEFIDDTVTITVQEAPALGILLYVAAAGVAVTIVAVIAFYFLRIRKPKPA